MFQRVALNKVHTGSFYAFCASFPFAGYGLDTGIATLSATNFTLLLTAFLTSMNLFTDPEFELTLTQIRVSIVGGLLSALIALQILLFDSVRIRLVATFIGCLLTFGIVTVIVDSRLRLRRALLATTIGVAIFSAIGVAAGFQLIQPVANVSRPATIVGLTLPFLRTTGGPLAYGTYGVLLTFSLSTALVYSIIIKSTIKRRVWVTLFIICFLGFIVGQSRSTFLAVVVTFTVLGILLYHRFLLPAGMGFNILYQSAKVFVLISIIPVSLALYSVRPMTVEVRIEQSVVAITEMLQNPLFGTTRDMILIETGGHIIHNAFLGVGALFGFPAFLLLGLIWLFTVKSGIQAVTHSQHSILAIILLSAILGSTVEHLFYFGVFSKTIWFAFALVISGSSVILQENDI